jgi:hypothetical protein
MSYPLGVRLRRLDKLLPPSRPTPPPCPELDALSEQVQDHIFMAVNATMCAAREFGDDPDLAGDDVARRLLDLARKKGPDAVVVEALRVVALADAATSGGPAPPEPDPTPAPTKPASKGRVPRVKGADLLRPPVG